MTIGAGIAVAVIWIVAGSVCLHRTILGLGMFMMLVAACVATSCIVGVHP